MIDEEELGEEEEEEEIDYSNELESEEISDIDDTELMKRLEAKYGKISGENSEDEDDPDAWTSNYDTNFNFKYNFTLIPFSFSCLPDFRSLCC